MPAPVTRIFSDLHYRDSESRLQALDTLAPLLAGAGHIVLNGDTLDTSPNANPGHLDEVRAFFSRQSGAVTLLSGNHDARISDQAELSLFADRVWITHGDVLFDDIAPWGSLRNEIARRLALLAHDTPASQRHLIETRLRLNRLACHDLIEPDVRTLRTWSGRAARLAHTLFPPHRVLAMLQAWRQTPTRARQLAREQRPRARLVILGHTHFPGVWHDPTGATVINTGAFCPPFAARFVEIQADQVRVIRIARRRGVFYPGSLITEFPLAP